MLITNKNLDKINLSLVTIDDFNSIKDDSLKNKLRSYYWNWLQTERIKDKERLK